MLRSSYLLFGILVQMLLMRMNDLRQSALRVAGPLAVDPADVHPRVRSEQFE